MKTVMRTLAVLAVLGLLGAAAVVGFGLYDVSARRGHLPGVSWVLHTTYRNAIRLRAPNMSQAPDLSDPDRIALGAGHYDSACAFCHGAPGATRSATALSMVPAPPPIRDAISDWAPNHLFKIVRDGIKMSGMPHWPGTRDEEVWTMVAYLESLRSAALPALEQKGAADPALAYCATCHGLNGNAQNAFVPRLDLQSETYLHDSLRAYRTGARDSGFMFHAATQVSDADLRRLAQHYAAQTPAVTADAGDPALFEDGKALAERGTVEVPACVACHGPGKTETSAHFPAIAGQPLQYLEQQLKLWREGARGGGRRQHLMRRAAAELTDADITALALYFSGLAPLPKP